MKIDKIKNYLNLTLFSYFVQPSHLKNLFKIDIVYTKQMT